jgi:hypothetical protein
VVIDRARWAHELPGGGFVNLGLGMAWCEASIPKRIDPDGSNVQAVDVATAVEVAREMLTEAERVCEWDRRVMDYDLLLAKVVRGDHVRDFDDVRRVAYILDGLASVPRADARWKTRRWQDTQRNAAETLRVGPRAWGGTLYDKHAESPAHAPPGRVRFEARLHGDQLRSRFALHNAGLTGIIGAALAQRTDRPGRRPSVSGAEA